MVSNAENKQVEAPYTQTRRAESSPSAHLDAQPAASSKRPRLDEEQRLSPQPSEMVLGPELSERVFGSPELLALILSKCEISTLFIAPAVARAWDAASRSVVAKWRDNQWWADVAEARDERLSHAEALCAEALAILHAQSGADLDRMTVQACLDEASCGDATRCSDRVLITCVELLSAARHSTISSTVRSKTDLCFLSWLTLTGTPKNVNIAIDQALELLVEKHIHAQRKTCGRRGSCDNAHLIIQKDDFQVALCPLLRKLVNHRVCLRGPSTLTAMLRVLRICAPFFNHALGNRLFEHLCLVAHDPTVLSLVGCPAEAQGQQLMLILEVMRATALSSRVLQALAECIQRIVEHTGQKALLGAVEELLAAHATSTTAT